MKDDTKYKGLEGLKQSKRATVAFSTFVVSFLYPVAMALISYILNKAGIDIDMSVYAPIVLGVITVLAGILITGYTIEDSIAKYREAGAIQPINIGEATGDVLNVVADYVDDGKIVEDGEEPPTMG